MQNIMFKTKIMNYLLKIFSKILVTYVVIVDVLTGMKLCT